METQLRHTAGGIHLTVSDKGQGAHGPVPASRPRRARVLGAHLSAQESGTGGRRIDLRLKPRRRPLFG